MAFPGKVQDVTASCDDDTYVALLAHIAGCQSRRCGVPRDSIEDRTQDAVAHYWRLDLRKTYRDDRGTAFHSYVTTCLFRYLCAAIKSGGSRLDTAAFAKHREELRGESAALALVDSFRASHGDALIDSLLLFVTRRPTPDLAGYSPHRRREILKRLILEIKEQHANSEEEAGTE